MSLFLAFIVACAQDEPAATISPAVPDNDVTLHYEGTAALPNLASGEVFNVRIEVRHIPDQATRLDVSVLPNAKQLRHDPDPNKDGILHHVGFTYSALETPDAIHVRAAMPNAPAAVRDLLVPYLNMKVSRKELRDPWLVPLEAPIRLLFEPAPILATLTPIVDIDKAWIDATVDGSLARALPVRRITRTVKPDVITLRVSIAADAVSAITHEARVYSSNGKYPDRMRLQWEAVTGEGARVVLLTALLRLSAEPRTDDLDVEMLAAGFESADNPAFDLVKAGLLDAVKNKQESKPIGRDKLLAAFNDVKTASAASAAAFLELGGRSGPFFDLIRTTEVGNPYTALEATFAYARTFKGEEAVRILQRGMNIERSPLWQARFHAAMAARLPTTLDLHSPDNDQPFGPFADAVMFETTDDETLKAAAEHYADLRLRLAVRADSPDGILDAAADCMDMESAFPAILLAARTVLEKNVAEWKEEVAPTLKKLCVSKSLPNDYRVELLRVITAQIAGEVPDRLKLFDAVEKRVKLAGWDAPLVHAFDESLEALPPDRLKRAAALFVDAMHQTVGAAEDLSKNQERNPLVRLAAADWKSTFEILEMENLNLLPFEFQMWEAVFAGANAEAFTKEALAAIDDGRLTPRGLKAFFSARFHGAKLVDAPALLDKANAKYPKDASLWTLRGSLGSLDAYKKALDLDKACTEAAVAVAESLPPADGVKLLDATPVTDAARPVLTRIEKLYQKAGASPARWTALVGR